jgi:hypothetical protein
MKFLLIWKTFLQSELDFEVRGFHCFLGPDKQKKIRLKIKIKIVMSEDHQLKVSDEVSLARLLALVI